MTYRLQPPVGTVFETPEQCELLKTRYRLWFDNALSEHLRGKDGECVLEYDLIHGLNLPYRVEDIHGNYIVDPYFEEHWEAVTPKDPIKFAVYVEGKGIPTETYTDRGLAREVGVRLATKENRPVWIVIDLIEPRLSTVLTDFGKVGE